MDHIKLLNYYRDCFAHDSADLNLWQLTKLKAQDKYHLLDSDELSSGFLPRQPIDAEFAKDMQGRLQMYQRERVLLYTSLLVVGKFEIAGENKTIVSPLIYAQANIEQDNNEYYLVLQEKPQLNESLLKLLLPEDSKVPESLLHDPSNGALWHRLLKQSPAEMELTPLLDYPRLCEPQALNSAQRRKTASVQNASMLVFVERSNASRGILHELQTLAEVSDWPNGLKQVLGDEQAPQQPVAVKSDYLPALLSKPQHQMLSVAASQSLGIVTGPPGTGKSYTIAAIAAEHMARGQAVLIVASSEPALEVIGDKIGHDFNLANLCIRAGQKDLLKQLKDYLAGLLSGAERVTQTKDIKNLVNQLKRTNRNLKKTEKRFSVFCQGAQSRGLRLHRLEQSRGWVKQLYLFIFARSIHALSRHWRALEQMNVELDFKHQLATDYLNACKAVNMNQLLSHHRKSLKAFNQAIRSRTSATQFERFDNIDFAILLQAFPIWLVSLNALHRVLPLKAEMFDLVIIDEASQSNIAAALPAIYRAKRTMVVGDDKQLRHYSFLAKSTEHAYVAKHQLNTSLSALVSYRDNSILDLVSKQINEQEQVVFLDEHFRCPPELIAFSNQTFYGGHLRVMRQRPCSSKGHIDIIRCQGLRDKNGINAVEAQQIIAWIQAKVVEDQHSGMPSSLGVMCLYRHQADYLKAEMPQHFSPEIIARHRIIVASPFGFQGEERDIVLMSFVIDNNSKRAAVYLNKPDVFNVAITRAKEQQVLMLSIDESILAPTHLLRRYIQSIEHFQNQLPATVEQDAFQQAVTEQLRQKDIECWCGYALGGLEVDILCRFEQRYLAIDLIGYPGKWQEAFELSHYKILKRMNMNVLPISWGLWTIAPERCIEQVLQQLKG